MHNLVEAWPTSNSRKLLSIFVISVGKEILMDTVIHTLVQEPGSLDRYIVSTAEVLGGKPRIAGHRIAVTHIKAWRQMRGMTEAEISEAFDLPLQAIYAAMAYYYEHKAEIDAQDVREANLVSEMAMHHPSKLKPGLISPGND
jgi:uncharacterized protein (DUF433 family)